MINGHTVHHRLMMPPARMSRDARASVSRKNHLGAAPRRILALTHLHLRMRMQMQKMRRMGRGRLKIRVRVLVGMLVQTVGSTRVCEVKG